VLDLVEALHLLCDQLGVPYHLDLAGAQLACPLQPQEERTVLGHVVRGRAEQLRVLGQDLARGRADDAGRRRGAGIAPRAAVDVHDQLHRAQPTRRGHVWIGRPGRPGRSSATFQWADGIQLNGAG
jgi:hypothetical protein